MTTTLLPLRQQRFGQMTADEARAAGNECSLHAVPRSGDQIAAHYNRPVRKIKKKPDSSDSESGFLRVKRVAAYFLFHHTASNESWPN